MATGGTDAILPRARTRLAAYAGKPGGRSGCLDPAFTGQVKRSGSSLGFQPGDFAMRSACLGKAFLLLDLATVLLQFAEPLLGLPDLLVE